MTNCHQLKMRAADGKNRLTDVADTEQLPRIIQSVPSKKAEPFKAWLAMVGRERIEETIDPEQAIDRALETYLKKGYSEKWVHQRLLAIRIRNELTPYTFAQNKLHDAVTGKTAAELISERATPDSPTMGLTTWKDVPDGKILKSDTLVAQNYLIEKELSRLNRLVSMFIDYAELMAEDEQLMSMQGWLNETDRFLINNRRKVLDGKGRISREAATKKVGAISDEFRKKQGAEYISEFDRQTEKYLKGEMI